MAGNYTHTLLTTSSDDRTSGDSNDFSVEIEATHLIAPVIGTSVGAVWFHNNHDNVNVNNNVLRFEYYPTSSRTYNVLPTDRIVWRYSEYCSGGIWSAPIIFSPSSIANPTTLTGASTFTDLTTLFGAHYNTTTGYPASDVSFSKITGNLVPSGRLWGFRNTGKRVYIEFDISDNNTAGNDLLYKLGFRNDTGIRNRQRRATTDGTYDEIGSISPSAHDLAIDPGWHTNTEVRGAIANFLNTVDTLTPVNLAIADVSTTDRRMEITNETSSMILWGSLFGSTIGDFIGLSRAENLSVLDGAVYVNTLPHYENLQGPEYAILLSNKLGRSNHIDSSGRRTPLVGRIPLGDTEHRGLAHASFRDNGIPDILFKHARDVSEVDIKLTDQNNNPLDIGSGKLVIQWKLYHHLRR